MVAEEAFTSLIFEECGVTCPTEIFAADSCKYRILSIFNPRSRIQRVGIVTILATQSKLPDTVVRPIAATAICEIYLAMVALDRRSALNYTRMSFARPLELPPLGWGGHYSTLASELPRR